MSILSDTHTDTDTHRHTHTQTHTHTHTQAHTNTHMFTPSMCSSESWLGRKRRCDSRPPAPNRRWKRCGGLFRIASLAASALVCLSSERLATSVCHTLTPTTPPPHTQVRGELDEALSGDESLAVLSRKLRAEAAQAQQDLRVAQDAAATAMMELEQGRLEEVTRLSARIEVAEAEAREAAAELQTLEAVHARCAEGASAGTCAFAFLNYYYFPTIYFSVVGATHL